MCSHCMRISCAWNTSNLTLPQVQTAKSIKNILCNIFVCRWCILCCSSRKFYSDDDIVHRWRDISKAQNSKGFRKDIVINKCQHNHEFCLNVHLPWINTCVPHRSRWYCCWLVGRRLQIIMLCNADFDSHKLYRNLSLRPCCMLDINIAHIKYYHWNESARPVPENDHFMRFRERRRPLSLYKMHEFILCCFSVCGHFVDFHFEKYNLWWHRHWSLLADEFSKCHATTETEENESKHYDSCLSFGCGECHKDNSMKIHFVGDAKRENANKIAFFAVERDSDDKTRNHWTNGQNRKSFSCGCTFTSISFHLNRRFS